MCAWNEMQQEWVLRKLIFHWLCKKCVCHLYTEDLQCVRCVELPEMQEAFPAHYSFAENAYKQLLAEKAASNAI